MDLTESRLSKAAAQDKINMMLADNSADYVVFYNGVDVTAFEFNDDTAIKEAENLEDFGEMYPESDTELMTLSDLMKDANVSTPPANYTSEFWDSFEAEQEELFSLSGMENIVER